MREAQIAQAFGPDTLHRVYLELCHNTKHIFCTYTISDSVLVRQITLYVYNGR